MIAEYKFKIDWTFIFLMFAPIFYIAGSDLRNAQVYFFQMASFMLVGMMHANKYVGLFLVYAVLQNIFMNITDSGHLFNLFLGAVVYQFIVKCSNPKEIKKYMGVYLGILVLNIIWCARQKLNVDPLFTMMEFQKQQIISEPSGFFGIPAFLGAYSALVTPFCFVLGGMWYPLVLLCAAGVILSKSSFAIVAFSVGVMFFLWFRNRILFWIAGALLLTAGSIYVFKYDMPGGEFFRRTNAWKIIEKESYQKPLFGHGLGDLQRQIFLEVSPSHNNYHPVNPEQIRDVFVYETDKEGKPELRDWVRNNFRLNDMGQLKSRLEEQGMSFQVWKEAHNEFLQTFYELGLGGLLIIALYFADLGKRFWRYGRKSEVLLALAASVLTILVTSLGHFPFHVARLAGPSICVLAFFDFLLIEARRVSESPWD